jgi:sporulation protein YtfJ
MPEEGTEKKQHPIEGLLKTAMEKINEMVDVNTILGEAVEAPDGNVILPFSKVSFGFAAGGTEFETEAQQKAPFGGGSGAGISLQPVGFLVVGQGNVRLLSVNQNAIYDRILDMAPQLLAQLGFGRKTEHGPKNPVC